MAAEPTTNRESVSSIQLALDLEHQLDQHDHDDPMSTPAAATSDPALPYDPEVLTSIIISLRAEMAKLTQERDESNMALADAGHKYAALEARTADMQELLDAEREKTEKLEKERDDALRLAQENDEQVSVATAVSVVQRAIADLVLRSSQINVLRTKVEESRRGLMRLQAESRRMSTQTLKTPGPLPLDLSLRSPGLSSGMPTSSKRQSFQISSPVTSSFRPPMGGGHRRISSMSDPGQSAAQLMHIPEPIGIDGLPPSPATHTFEDIKSADGSTIKTKRLSLVAARRDASPPSAVPSSILMAELESLRTELANAQKQLEAANHDLAEAHDKRDASEACIKALREFIAEQAIGATSTASDAASLRDEVGSPVASLRGLKLPPLPSENHIDDSAAATAPPVQQKSSGGWGLNLWKTSSSSSSSAEPTPAPIPATQAAPPSEPGSSTPLTSFVSSWTRSVSGNNVSSQATPNPNNHPASSASSATASPNPGAEAGGLRKFSFFSKPANPPLPNPVQSSSSKAPSISSTATPELSRSRSESTSTSPQTETRSIVSSAGDAGVPVEIVQELTVDREIEEARKGDVTPTSGQLEAVAL